MDWDGVIEKNREALKRVVAALVAMTEAGCRGQFTFFPQGGARPQEVAQAEKSKLSPAPPHPEVRAEGEPRRTLPRHLHRSVLRLLRPAEAAVRRLVIVFARGLVVELPPARKPKPKPKSAILRNGRGTGIILPPHLLAQSSRPARRTLSLPLTDRLNPLRTRRPVRSSVPRISFPGFTAPYPVRVRRPPLPNDPLDATRLTLRLAALHAALDDLPKQARRFARWKARRDAGLVRRLSPLRPGRAPGLNAANRRKPSHEVHEVLLDLQYFAHEALKAPDTS